MTVDPGSPLGMIPQDASARSGTARRIEEEALRLFFERGYRATTMRDIAKACGITAGALYNHFVSKEQILVSLIVGVHDHLESVLLEAVAVAGEDPRARLSALARTHALVHTRYRIHARVANADIQSLPEPERTTTIQRRRNMRKLFERTIVDGVQRGHFEVRDPATATLAILNMGIHIADWFQPGGRLSDEEVAAIHADLAMRMVKGDAG